ncbi:hypothetical protein PMAYCL1PPCAC_04852, partial [Pristionchus mayeri]
PLEWICPVEDERQENATVPWMVWSQDAFDNGCVLLQLTSWVSGTLSNMFPSFVLLIFTILLASEMIKFQTRKESKGRAKRTKRSEEAERTTRMLIAVAVITLVSELPPGLLNIANALLSQSFREQTTDQLAGVWMVSQLIATSCNLIVYLVMSKRFRQEALKTICFWRSQTRTPRVFVS